MCKWLLTGKRSFCRDERRSGSLKGGGDASARPSEGTGAVTSRVPHLAALQEVTDTRTRTRTGTCGKQAAMIHQPKGAKGPEKAPEPSGEGEGAAGTSTARSCPVGLDVLVGPHPDESLPLSTKAVTLSKTQWGLSPGCDQWRRLLACHPALFVPQSPLNSRGEALPSLLFPLFAQLWQ